MSALNEWAASIRVGYGVDPRVFIALVVVSIPPFYAALALAVRAALRARRTGSPIWSDRAFLVAAGIVAAAWALPYAYVALFGHLPAWGWAVFVVLVFLGATRLCVTLRRRATRDREVIDE